MLSQEQQQKEPQAVSSASYERGSIAFVDEDDQAITDPYPVDSIYKMRLVHAHPNADQFEWTITRGFEILVDEETTTTPAYQHQFSEPGAYTIYATAYSAILDSQDSESTSTKTILTEFSKRVVIGESCSSENILEFELKSGSLTLGQAATFEIHNSDLFTSVAWNFTLPSQEVTTAEGPTATFDIPSESHPGSLIIEVTATPIELEQSQCLNYRKKYFKVNAEESIHFNPSVLMNSDDQIVAVSLENNDIYRYDRASKLQYISTDVSFAESCTAQVEGSSSLSLSCANGRIDLPLVSGTECQEFKTTLTASKGTASQEQVYYNYCAEEEDICFFGPESRRLSHHSCTVRRLAASADGVVGQVSQAVGGSGPPQCGSQANTCAVGERVEIDSWLSRYYNTVRYDVWQCRAEGYGTMAFCQKLKTPVNGQCGTSYGECVSGNSMGIIPDRQWGCQGSGGGRTVFCSMPAPRCGETHNTCAVGELRDISDTATQCRWMCTGYIGVLCTESIEAVNGQCGTTHNNCVAGQAQDVDDTSTHYKWQCTGLHGGTTADCQEANPSQKRLECIAGLRKGPDCEEPKPSQRVRSPEPRGDAFERQELPRLNGVCDTSRQNGCTAGIANDEIIPDTDTHYKWRCLGQNGGENADCEKEKPRTDGQCGTYNKCLAGDFYDRSDNNRFYRWLCRGVNGGQTVTCRERKRGPAKPVAQSPVTGDVVHGQCSSTLNECLSGEFVDRTDNHRYQRWLCVGSNHNEARTRGCRIQKQSQNRNSRTVSQRQTAQRVHGQCGPNRNTCLSGTSFRDRRDSRRYHRWYCDGLNGGRTRACRTRK